MCNRGCSGKMVSFLGVLGGMPVISRLGHVSTALFFFFFFTWGICIDGSLTITLLIPLPLSGDDDPM